MMTLSGKFSKLIAPLSSAFKKSAWWVRNIFLNQNGQEVVRPKVPNEPVKRTQESTTRGRWWAQARSALKKSSLYFSNNKAVELFSLHPCSSLSLRFAAGFSGKDWRREKKGTTEDEMVGWHHWLDGREFEWTPGVGDGQGGLACCDSWGHKELDTTERLNWTKLNLTLRTSHNSIWLINHANLLQWFCIWLSVMYIDITCLLWL